MLTALHTEYGGSYSVSAYEGDTVMVQDREFELKHDVGFWQIEAEKARKMLSMAQPHLLLIDIDNHEATLAA